VSRFTAVYDACVLYPAPLRSLLMYLALTDLFCLGNTRASDATSIQFDTLNFNPIPRREPHMATKEERALARRMFKCDCILAHAKKFQDLFWAVMKAKHGTAFETVGPQGSKGDGGNDGYLPADKHYYQLYAPVAPNEKAGVAAKKLRTDFATVKAQWCGKGARGLSIFTFAYNDKYEGTPKDIGLSLQDLRKKHGKVTFLHCGAADLETEFMALPDTEWDRILGGAVPDPDRLVGLDFTVLAEVIRHVLDCDVDEAESRLDLPPDLDEKIKLNKLSKVHAVRIQSGALLTGRIVKYFQSNSGFALSELRDHVVGVFETAKRAVSASPPHASTAVVDAVFTLFRRSLFPKTASTATASAVDAVIGYFFEACDVFDPKPTAKGRPGASP
jgi:hypothetical protein